MRKMSSTTKKKGNERLFFPPSFPYLVESSSEVWRATFLGNRAIGRMGLEKLVFCLEGVGNSLVLLDVLLTPVNNWNVSKLQRIRAPIQDIKC
jgi:hypothetical protein